MRNIFNRSQNEKINIKLINNKQEAEIYLSNFIKNNTVVSVDIVILDLELFKPDNNQLLRLLKTNEETKEIPVLIFSDSNMVQDINNSYILNANCFVKKPIALKDYIDTIQSVKNFWMNSEVVSLPSIY